MVIYIVYNFKRGCAFKEYTLRKVRLMTLWQSLLYGFIQGLTEFLPVSSSGHVAIAEALFGFDPGSSLPFTVLLHAGTLVSLIVVCRRKLAKLVRAFFTLVPKLFRRGFKLSEASADERMLVFTLISTLPLVPAAAFKDRIETAASDIRIVGAILIVNSVVLFLAGRLSREDLPPEKVKIRHALAVGVSQAFALFPGLSRSGTTVSTGLFMGFEREYAAEFSFIMSIPAVLGACALDLPGFISESAAGDPKQTAIFLAGALAAALTGAGAIRLLFLIVRKNKFEIFSLYSLAAGVFAIAAGFAIKG